MEHRYRTNLKKVFLTDSELNQLNNHLSSLPYFLSHKLFQKKYYNSPSSKPNRICIFVTSILRFWGKYLTPIDTGLLQLCLARSLLKYYHILG